MIDKNCSTNLSVIDFSSKFQLARVHCRSLVTLNGKVKNKGRLTASFPPTFTFLTTPWHLAGERGEWGDTVLYLIEIG